MQALTKSAAGLKRLRLITQIPDYASFAAAARDHYDGNDTALRQRVLAIERAVGFQIIDRSRTPLSPTERGREFLHEATEIIRAANEASRS
jgi:DNA-binding transcriptional LysR family regulator